MNSRILWISLASVILLIVVIAVGASLLISGFLRSEAFRKLMGAKTGEALYSEATYSPLSWSGPSMFVDSLQATGLEGSIVQTLRADQVRADVNWRAIFQGAWRVDQIQVVSFDATFRPGSIVRKEGSPTSPPPAHRNRLLAADALRDRGIGHRASPHPFSQQERRRDCLAAGCGVGCLSGWHRLGG